MLLNHFEVLLLLGTSLARASSISYPRSDTKRAAYFLDNDAAGNQLISLKINADDGTLSSLVRTPTDGKGLAGLIAVSQDSVITSGNVRSNLPIP